VHDLDRELNEAQRDAVLAGDGPLCILAGAGSGKTRVITYRIARLIETGVDPRAILAVTFTNKAAGEMRERAARMTGSAAGMWIGTFHSISARLLRTYADEIGLRRDFVIYDDSDTRTVCARVLKELNLSDRLFPVRMLLSRIDDAKNRGQLPNEVPAGDWQAEVVKKVYTAYQDRLLKANAVDFGDLLLYALKLCQSGRPVAAYLARRFRHVLVDEFQDTNRVQYLFARHIASGSNNLTVVGDDDQSIYRWRGADLRNILDFEQDYPGARTIKLERNYRSTKTILAAANGVISRNTARKAKTLYTDNPAGPPIMYLVCDSEREEARRIAQTIRGLEREENRKPGDCAVFYRTHAQSRVIEEALRAENLHYSIVGGLRFYDRAEIKDLCAYLKVLQNPDDEVGLLRIANVPARGLGDTSLEKLVAQARQDNTSVYEAMRRVATGDVDVIGTAARRKLAGFIELMDELRGMTTLPPADLAELVLERTGYLARLGAEGTDEAETRSQNLMEFIGDIREYQENAEEPSLAGYLERISLASEADRVTEADVKVSLMTIHSAKGLEFPVVFLAGMEEGIFPHARGREDPEEMEEERRLAYVAITRARERLLILRATSRMLYGQPQQNAASRFINDIPVECVAVPRGAGGERRDSGHGGGGRGGYERGGAERGGYGRGGGAPARIPPAPRGRQVEYVDAGASPAPARRDRGDSVIEYDEPQGDTGYRIGMRVSHPSFGEGEVRGWTGIGPSLKLTIFFPRAGVKTIVAKFVQAAE
jgi:DNA helicase-2/ATP-dependent DNA helicase PcrA